MPSFTSKSLRRKKKTAQQFRRGSKTFRRNKKLRQNISAKKIYTKGKQFRRVARGFVDDLRESVNIANNSEEKDCVICFSYISPSTGLKLICGHTFHKDCIKKSL